MNAQLSTTDYSNIAKMILANVPDENKTFEVELATDMYTVFLEVDYDVGADGFRSFKIENLITLY